MNDYVCDACGYAGFKAAFTGTVDFAVLVFCPGCAHELRRKDDPLAAFEPNRGVTYERFAATL